MPYLVLILGYVESFIFSLLSGILKIFPSLWPRGQKFFKERSENVIDLKKNTKSRSILVYCSSAGEYEQALPLVDLFEKWDSEIFIHIIFFSNSGLIFAKAKNEHRSFSLAPVCRPKLWDQIFEKLNPIFSIIVRHEIWPTFLVAAKRHAPVYLINATIYGNFKPFRQIKNVIQKFFYQSFDHIFVISTEDKKKFSEVYKMPLGKVSSVGDTKYDRVLELSNKKNYSLKNFNEFLSILFKKKPLLVMGSAWTEDVDVCLKTLEIKRRQNLDYSVILVPHEPTEIFISSILEKCKLMNIKCLVYSTILNQPLNEECDILIFDKIGFLSEMYCYGTWAFVGGGMHHKVHNVLEPATCGLSIAFGPYYENSPEALRMVKSGLAKVVKTPEDFLDFWNVSDHAKILGHATFSSLKPLSGASQRIFKFLVKADE
jgi:3-deoxy-D-manno-octulosonic-acid transferase